MASNSEPELRVDPYISVLLRDFIELSSASTAVLFMITITAKLTCPSEAEEEGDDVIGGLPEERPGRSIQFWNSFSMSLGTLDSGGAEGRVAVASMLSDVHVPHSCACNAVSKIVECCRGMASKREPHQRVLHVDVYIDAFVDELPKPSENDRFLRAASKESIEDLEKLRIEVPEKSVTCSVCLDDVPVGSEATRLPCSHLYHGDCIVEWLNKRKFCPLSRFELAS
ncbi:E3 ubiquitin-protein ligase CIP8 [Morus notabilis]|uniref:RING-type E3 ubiquitin transferase n=1 Tax=Morus notabilis TaxID=981085 RepID=W9RIJ2_9ROSA|nr:E3 ubiquitin-protein ligase CIP8 [Morus notabilis]